MRIIASPDAHALTDSPSPRHDSHELIDIDDTSECPSGAACGCCGAAGDLAVGTAEARGIGAGVFCVTLCAACVLEPLPSLAPLEALTRVCRHAEHLGIDLDLMAELVRSAGGDRR